LFLQFLFCLLLLFFGVLFLTLFLISFAFVSHYTLLFPLQQPDRNQSYPRKYCLSIGINALPVFVGLVLPRQRIAQQQMISAFSDGINYLYIGLPTLEGVRVAESEVYPEKAFVLDGNATYATRFGPSHMDLVSRIPNFSQTESLHWFCLLHLKATDAIDLTLSAVDLRKKDSSVLSVHNNFPIHHLPCRRFAHGIRYTQCSSKYAGTFASKVSLLPLWGWLKVRYRE